MSDEPDEALLWAREQVPEGWYEDEDDLEWRAKAYRAGQAAAAERIKALEEEVARLKTPTIPHPAPKTSRTVYLWSPAP